jgi:ubiquinone/menaquinone biosynthesis C-methylase UbiE
MSAPIRFEDGAGYERYMGVWSQLAGREFIHWLSAPPGVHWLDIGCGSGAFTELVCDLAEPHAVTGIDPSEPQVAFARRRMQPRNVHCQVADAHALPFGDHRFDVAVMPLVIFFLNEPVVGVREMARVLRPGGLAAAYAWDMDGGAFPYAPVLDSLADLGADVPGPPHPEASRIDVLESLWTQCGFQQLRTTSITVQRTYPSFDEYWETVQLAPSARRVLDGETSGLREQLRALLDERLLRDRFGQITATARAHAVCGRLPLT